jgi:hypothetical protein
VGSFSSPYQQANLMSSFTTMNIPDTKTSITARQTITLPIDFLGRIPPVFCVLWHGGNVLFPLSFTTVSAATDALSS